MSLSELLLKDGQLCMLCCELWVLTCSDEQSYNDFKLLSGITITFELEEDKFECKIKTTEKLC